jgi:hypothetical protein
VRFPDVKSDLQLWQRLSIIGHRRAKVCRRLFKNVLDLSIRRIVQRLQPPWARLPAYIRVREEPLWQKLDDGLLKRFEDPLSERCISLRSQLEDLLACLRLLENETSGEELVQITRKAVRKCADVSYQEQGSLEKQLNLLRGSFPRGWDSRAVRQVDKLARYFGLCKDFSRIARRPSYRVLFQNITLQTLEAFPESYPLGTSRKCFVHAETQIVLDLERNAPSQLPRAIGCSKSACFLCDMLLRNVGRYAISVAHRRLYPQWTIPEADWMTPEQAQRLRGLVDAMTKDIEALTRQLRKQRFGGGRYTMESRTVLPLLSESTASRISGLSKSHSTLLQSDESGSRSTLRGPWGINPSHSLTPALSTVILSASDLPFDEPICVNTPSMRIYIDSLTLTFEFLRVSAGRLSVSEVRDNSATDNRNLWQIPVADISTTEMAVPSPANSSSLGFRLDYFGKFAIQIEIYWGMSGLEDERAGCVAHEPVSLHLAA